MRDQRNIQLHQSFKPIANKLQQKCELKKKYLKKKDKPITTPKKKPLEND